MGVSADTSCDARVASTEPCRWAVAGMHGGRFGEPLVMLRAAAPCLVWGFAGTYHKGLVLTVHRPPRTNPVPKTATNRQPNQKRCILCYYSQDGRATRPWALFCGPRSAHGSPPAVLTNQHAALLSAAPLPPPPPPPARSAPAVTDRLYEANYWSKLSSTKRRISG